MRAHLLYDVQRVGLVVPAADPEHAVSSVHCSVALRPYAVRSGGQHPCPKKIDVAVGVPCHLLQGCSVEGPTPLRQRTERHLGPFFTHAPSAAH